MAQVDAKVHDVSVIDCSTAPRDAGHPLFLNNCLATTNPQDAKSYGGTSLTMTVVKTMGLAYVTAGGGVAYTIADHQGVVLNLNFMIPFPASGVVLEPSLGYQIGI